MDEPKDTLLTIAVCCAAFVSISICAMLSLREPVRPLSEAQDSVVLVESAKQSKAQPTDIELIGSGSGIILDAQGHVAICEHQTEEGADLFFLTLRDGRHYQARVAFKSPELDVAILQVIGPMADVLPAIPAAGPSFGDPVVAISNPGRRRWLATAGIVGQVEAQSFIIDAAINPGSSGGAVFDTKGHVVGMATGMIGPPPLMFFEGYATVVKSDAIYYALRRARSE